MTCSTSCAARWTPNKNARLRDLGKLLAASQDHDDRHAHEFGILRRRLRRADAVSDFLCLP